MTCFSLGVANYALCILHKGGLAVAAAVELKVDCVVGADLCAVEASCAARIVYETLLYLDAFRSTHVLTFHATDAFVGINCNVHQCLRVQTP